MQLPNRAATLALLATAVAASVKEWMEAVVVQNFLEQSPRAREARARVAIASMRNPNANPAAASRVAPPAQASGAIIRRLIPSRSRR